MARTAVHTGGVAEAPSARVHGHITFAAFSLSVQYPQTTSHPLRLLLTPTSLGRLKGSMDNRDGAIEVKSRMGADQPSRFNLINLDGNCIYVERRLT